MMAITLAQAHAKAQAFVDALCKLPRSQYAAVPSGDYGRDYNALRTLALEALPGIDQRLLGQRVGLRVGATGREVCEASFVEIETYAREILGQLTAAMAAPSAPPAPPCPPSRSQAAREKAYDVAEIRREHNQAYAPWTEQDDEYLRCRYLEGATIDDLVWEFGRRPGGIRSRLRRLGLDPQLADRRAAAPPAPAAAVGERGSPGPDWRDLRPNAGRAWSGDDDERLLREYEAGTPVEAIAEALGRGVFSVEVRLCKLGRTPGK
jgi:hypothetical protein